MTFFIKKRLNIISAPIQTNKNANIIGAMYSTYMPQNSTIIAPWISSEMRIKPSVRREISLERDASRFAFDAASMRSNFVSMICLMILVRRSNTKSFSILQSMMRLSTESSKNSAKSAKNSAMILPPLSAPSSRYLLIKLKIKIPEPL